MKVDVINRILEGVPGVRKDGASWLVPEDTDLSFYIGLPAEVLSITRVARGWERHSDHVPVTVTLEV